MRLYHRRAKCPIPKIIGSMLMVIMSIFEIPFGELERYIPRTACVETRWSEAGVLPKLSTVVPSGFLKTGLPQDCAVEPVVPLPSRMQWRDYRTWMDRINYSPAQTRRWPGKESHHRVVL